ncbi:MAG: PSD1 and planctomycete cytochrome C domain-containing protein [Chitinophagaceae bacterium]
MKKLLTVVLIISTGLILTQFSCSDKTNTKTGGEMISYNFQVRPILSDKCYNCHGPDANKREAGLRLDIAEEAYKALKEHPRAHAITPFDPESSELFVRINSTDTAIRMPPPSSNLQPLNKEEIEVIRRWIKQGAKYEPHWAFMAPRKSTLPEVNNPGWCRNEIDRFVMQQLERNNLKPNPEADKERLLKRVTLDLTGLPPSPKQIDAFLKDPSANAYEKVVDDLLMEPAYGERMALPWLDLARFADSHGYQDDNYRSQWPWRDWTIHAFNRNMPYDQFVTWQLAGDLLPDATKEQLLASGFNRNHKITEEGGVIDEEYRVEYVSDRTTTLGRAFMGITIECAKCHDHKFDPISQKEYYQVYAFFNNIKEVGHESNVGGPETYAKNPRMDITPDDLKGILHFVNKQDTSKLQVSVMKERDTLRKTFILDRGNYDAPTAEVQASTPAVILPFAPGYPRNRLGLAQWLFDPANPLTARVFVNRMWQEFFGRGIVKSAADFGMQGSLPSHPALLDWLAVDFRDHKWDIKRLVKHIVMSATYRQSAVAGSDKIKKDPENVYLSYAPRIRLHAELVRDMVLASSGLLKQAIGGPSVKPYQPPGLWELATSGRGLTTYKQDHGDQLYRRGMYTFIKRTVPPPSKTIFDASNRDECEVKRSRTNTPLQALVMMNDPVVLEASLALADRLLSTHATPDQNIVDAFKRIICRSPTKKESEILVNYWKEQDAFFRASPASAAEIIQVGEYKRNEKISPSRLAALMQVIQTIYNVDEAITRS